VRRAQLLRAALPAFAEQGFEGVELQSIADEVGVTRNLIHHYFPGGKSELHAEAVRLACSELVEILDVDPGVSLDRKMPANVGAYLEEILKPSARYRLYGRALQSADEEIRTAAAAAREQIAAGVARNHLGVSRPPKPLRAALVGFIAFTETTTERWRDLGIRDKGRLERLIMDVLVATVAAARSGAPGQGLEPQIPAPEAGVLPITPSRKGRPGG
jgi:AcrR family transcriptional regulator